jgi:hypothetical protein
VSDDPSMDARRVFLALMKERGHDMPAARVLDLQPPLDDSGDTDCWTHAYRRARATGASYYEGLVYLPPRDGRPVISAHAWVVQESPFGAQVVELTRGYERAWGYRGMRVDLDSEEADRAEHGGHRYGVLELDIAVRLIGKGH